MPRAMITIDGLLSMDGYIANSFSEVKHESLNSSSAKSNGSLGISVHSFSVF